MIDRRLRLVEPAASPRSIAGQGPNGDCRTRQLNPKTRNPRGRSTDNSMPGGRWLSQWVSVAGRRRPWRSRRTPNRRAGQAD
jgi:hypothetical protein